MIALVVTCSFSLSVTPSMTARLDLAIPSCPAHTEAPVDSSSRPEKAIFLYAAAGSVPGVIDEREAARPPGSAC